MTIGTATGVATFSVWWLVGMTILAVALTYVSRGLGRLEGLGILLLYVPFSIVIATR